jgi:peptidoglycan hydrolase-like protein with peptidoglycan-binding domain
MICKGMNGADVTVLQALLVAHGYTLNAVNGVFDASTDKAVRKYQEDNGLTVDGVVGPQTWAKLLGVN